MLLLERLRLGVVVGALALSGCYLAHRTDPALSVDAGTPDASPSDASRPDAGHDAGFDAGGRACVGVELAETVEIDDSEVGSVTPRLVALPGGELGLVHVRSDGSPSRIRYERLSARLDRLHSTDATTTSWTWAQPVLRDGQPWIAHGGAGEPASLLQRLSPDGEPSGPALTVPIFHPTILRPTRGGFFWLTMTTRGDNALLMVHLDTAGVPLYPTAEVALGRYGSGHGAIAHPDGRSFVITYPREGPRGVRNAYVNAINEDGELGPELPLSPMGDQSTVPLRQEDSLLVVSQGDGLVLDRRDFDTLELQEQFVFAPRGSRLLLAGVLAGRLIVAYRSGSAVRFEDFGEELLEPGGPLGEVPSRGRGESILVTTSAIYVATIATSGHPFVARLECVYE